MHEPLELPAGNLLGLEFPELRLTLRGLSRARMDPADLQLDRLRAVLSAVANLQDKGIAVSPDVMHLYGRYVVGDLSRKEVQVIMQERALALGGQRRYPLQRTTVDAPTA